MPVALTLLVAVIEAELDDVSIPLPVAEAEAEPV